MATRHHTEIPAERRYVIGSEPPASAPARPAAPDWRTEVRGASGLNVLVGIWLIISPFVLGYTSADATWNPIVFGAIVAVLALARAAGAFRATALSAINMLIGAWLFASAFWLADSGQASWNVGIAGVVVFVLAAWSMSVSAEGTADRSVVR